jgi:hypothetical protein
MEQNRQYSDLHVENEPFRARLRKRHSTQIGVWECMDGRTRMESVSEMLPGILQTWANGGGVFSLTWPYFQSSFMDWYRHARENSRECILLVVWHRSRSHTHLGCKAHQYDDAMAESVARAQAKELWNLFKEDDQERHLYPVVCCLETDSEGLAFRMKEGSEVLDLFSVLDFSERELRERVYALYPEIPHRILNDLLATVISGNIQHIRKVMTLNRTVEACDHCESIIAVGRGFGWLNREAFVIAPFDPRFPDMVATAAKIVLGNIEKGTIDVKKGAMLLASAPSRTSLGKPGREVAGLKASKFLDDALSVIKERVPELVPYLLSVVAGTEDNTTRRFRIVNLIRHG